jgi:pimeloyl-ACP methyl ester carboxylesterase
MGLERIKGYVGQSGPVNNWEEAVAQARAINEIAFPDFTDGEWEAFARGLYREENGVPVLAYDPAISQPMNDAASSAVPPDLWPLFEAIAATPMLVIRGELSDILAPAAVARMKDMKPDLQFVEVPNRGHAPTLNEPAARGAIERFLDTLQR